MTTPDTLASLIAKYRAKSQDSDVPKPRAETYGYVAAELEAALDALVEQLDDIADGELNKQPVRLRAMAAELRGRGASDAEC